MKTENLSKQLKVNKSTLFRWKKKLPEHIEILLTHSNVRKSLIKFLRGEK